MPPPKTCTPMLKEELKIEGDPKAFFLAKIQETVRDDKYNLADLSDLAFLHYEASN